MSNDVDYIGGEAMTSKLKQRRLRRLKSDVAWWMAEAREWKQIALEHADTIAFLQNKPTKSQPVKRE
jgi:hypothetical protein